MTATLFLLFVAFMAGVVVWLMWRGPGGRAAAIASMVLLVGVIRSAAMRPPGMVFLFVPVVLFLIAFVARALASKQKTGLAIPLAVRSRCH